MKDEILINRYLDQEASPKEMKEVEVRLGNDQKFASLYKKFKEVDNLLEKVENGPVPEDIYKRVLSSVKYRPKAKPFYVRFAPALIGSVMSFALGIMFSSFLFTSQLTNVNAENSSTYSTDLYSTLDMDEVINYYYGD